MLSLMYITKRPEVAAIVERAGVNTVFVDLETLGKAERQGGMDTVQCAHTVDDVAAVRAVLTRASLLARCNPVHDALSGIPSTEDEVEALVEAGADILMLPYFKTEAEAARFLAAVDGRARTCLLFETPEAVAAAERIVSLPGVDEAYVGLNDLSLARGDAFMFESLADGTVERLAHTFLAHGVPFGFGGIARVGGGLLPGARVIREHYRLGSTRAILSRSFCNAERAGLAEVGRTFAEGVAEVRACEAACERHLAFFTENAVEVRSAVARIAGRGEAGGEAPLGNERAPLSTVLLTGAVPQAEGLASRLAERGYKTLFLPDERAELTPEAREADVVVCNNLFDGHSVGDFPRLRHVQLTSAGTDRVPVAELAARGVRLTSARGVYSVPMAEHVVCVALMLLRQMPGFARSQAKHAWEKQRDLRELAGLAACVVGCGGVGTEVAMRLAALGAVVTGVDPDAAPREGFAGVVSPEGLNGALAQADIVVLAAPLTPETRGMFDAKRLASCKPGAYLINVSRGALVDEAALADALDGGRLAGAALDVFAEEPLSASSPLWDREDVIVTPHNSFVGDHNAERLHDLVLRNLAVVLPAEARADLEGASGHA